MLASREAEILQKEAEVENLLQHKSTLDARMVSEQLENKSYLYQLTGTMKMLQFDCNVVTIHC